MKWFVFFLVAGFVLAAGRAIRTPAVHTITSGTLEDALRDFDDADDSNVKAHWALLIAGSAGYGNYRHQADVCHAYHILRQGGLDDDHIVVMMADDLANNVENPYPGKLFNRPGGPDVYAGVPKDYTGTAVTSETFLAALTGNVTYLKGKGSGKAITSGPNDRVFVFYSDHGAPGIVGMPSGPFLYADQLMDALHTKYSHKGFKEAVLYVEACESGSMFEGLLEDDMSIYATTAANSYESSWATYCPGMDPEPAPEFTTCLGDLYSIAWMENCEQVSPSNETLERQYVLVETRTSQNFTYMQGSHVMQYGDLGMDVERAGDYMGMGNGTAPSMLTPPPASRQGAVNQRDAEVLHLRLKRDRAATPAAQAQAQAELDAELDSRQRAATMAQRLSSALLSEPATAQRLLRRLPWPAEAAEDVHQAVSASTPRNCLHCAPPASPPQQLVDLLLVDSFGRPARGKPLVEDWECLRAMVTGWESQMGPMSTFSMQFTRFFANLCNAGVSARTVTAHLRSMALQLGGEDTVADS